jgi:hypothetical protein
MMRSLLLAVVVLGAVCSSAVAAPPAPTVSVDPRYAVAGKGISRTDFASNFAADTPNGTAVDGDRIYAVGEADGNVAILAQNKTGGYDTGFSGDGKLTLPISADPARDFATSLIVMPDHSLRVIGATDSDPATGTSNLDIVMGTVSSTGDVDPSSLVIFGVGAGDDQPTRIAHDPQTGRIAIVGHTNGQNDSFIAVRNADGSPAAFGVGGSVIFDAGSGLTDQAVDVAWRPGGGLAVLDKVETDPTDAGRGWISVVRGFTETGETDLSFNGGSLQIAVGQPDTTPGGLIAWGGRLWVTGSTKDSGDTNAWLARLNPDGTDVQTRMFDMHGQSTKAEDQTSSQGIDLDVLNAAVPTLVVVGSSTNLAGAAEWSAAAFNGLDGDVASFGMGDLTIPYDAGQGAAIGVAAGNGFLGVAGSLLVTSPSAELSFGTSRLLIDAEKECDLSLTIVRPLELSMHGDSTAPVRLAVENKGTKICGGRLQVPAPYSFRGVVDTGQISPGATVTMDVTLVYGGVRRFDDIVPISVEAAGDTDTTSNTKLIHVVYIYCDVRLSVVDPPNVMPVEGGERVAFSVRNLGTTACRDARITALSGGSRSDRGDSYTIPPARSVTDEAVLTLKANARVGKRASLHVAARSKDEAARDNDSVEIRPLVLGVGDSAIRSRSARLVTGTAKGARGPDKAALRRLVRVEVSIKRIAGTKKKPSCSWLRSSKSRALSRRSCASAVWVRASGTSRWRLRLSRALPAGRYEIRSRAVIRSGFREARFSARDRNLAKLRVR